MMPMKLELDKEGKLYWLVNNFSKFFEYIM
jgi:hypothetical protein